MVSPGSGQERRKFGELDLGSVQKLIPVLAGVPSGQMRSPREGVYPMRYSTDPETPSLASMAGLGDCRGGSVAVSHPGVGRKKALAYTCLAA